jgi:hypothetical protein
MIAIIAVFLMAVPIVSGEEEWTWRENSQDGVQKAEADNIKSDKGFGAQLLITDDKDYLEKWKDPAEPFQLRTVNFALRGQPVFILIIFANPGVDEKGMCDIVVDFKITRPDGTISRDMKDSDCWRNMLPPPAGNIQLGKTSIGIGIDDKDLAGRWKVEAVVKDGIKNAAVQLFNYFDVK